MLRQADNPINMPVDKGGIDFMSFKDKNNFTHLMTVSSIAEKKMQEELK